MALVPSPRVDGNHVEVAVITDNVALQDHLRLMRGIVTDNLYPATLVQSHGGHHSPRTHRILQIVVDSTRTAALIGTGERITRVGEMFLQNR